eukprot:TRINITY_DN198_c0_g1_i1.p1 TRINITY_DN198_c0_g1~~TRINITY_DN198_c0_g1_i1.p1  ORF type:complete len:113 (+),score=3.65 TRINITY_DN198_c0_g1_i1:46-384(+)
MKWGVAVDGSGPSKRALSEAIRLAKPGDTLVLISALNHVQFDMRGAKSLKEDQIAELKKLLEPFIEEFKKEKLLHKFILREGAPREIIVDECRKEKVDYLVMGAHGITGLKK